MGKEPACNVGDTGDACSVPWPGRSPGEAHGNPLQYCCLENPMDRGAWKAIAHTVTKSWTRLSTHTQPGGSVKNLSAMQKTRV